MFLEYSLFSSNFMKLFFVVSILISMILIILSFFLSEKSVDKEKTSMYECGFSPMKNSSNPFSIKFFVVAIMFLVFDLEMIMLFPWSMISLNVGLEGSSMFIMFFIMLVLGLVYEWVNGGLNWE